MEEKSKLSDIVLKKGDESGDSKKIILTVATLGVILIVVVMLMNTLSSDGEGNLPKAILPPEPEMISNQTTDEDPLFEEVEIVQEDETYDDSLTKIAQKLKQESINEEKKIVKDVESKKVVQTKKPAKPTKVVKKVVTKKPAKPAKVVKKVVTKKPAKPAKVVKKVVTNSKKFYVQVGSFSTYAPNKKFLKSILAKGYKYKFHKINNLNKVLVGPFKSEKDARTALVAIRRDIEAGAFLTRI
jgi:DedD protein